MVGSNAIGTALVLLSVACAPTLRLEPLPRDLGSRDPAADAATAFTSGDRRLLAYQTGFGLMVPGVAREVAGRLNAHHALRIVGGSSDVSRAGGEPQQRTAAEFAALGEYVLAYNTAMACRRAHTP